MSTKTILEQESILDALKRLDKFTDESLTLFVIDSNEQMVGTLTDGDIRRYLVAGGSLSDECKKAMHTNFFYVKKDISNAVTLFRELKNRDITLVPSLDEEGHIVNIYDLTNYKSHLPIDAVLMAGGKGERLRPLTDNIPKPLLPLGNKPIIDYIIEYLISFGIKNINVTTNYLHEKIEEHFIGSIKGICVKTVLEPRYLGTIGSIRFIESFENDTILLMNSDALTDLDLESFYLHFEEHDADMSIAAIPYDISVPYGIFELDGRNVIKVLEKPTYSYYANSGIYLIKKELLSLIPTDTFYNATDFMELLINKGYKVIRYPLNGMWLDIGSPREYQKAKELIKHIKH